MSVELQEHQDEEENPLSRGEMSSKNAPHSVSFVDIYGTAEGDDENVIKTAVERHDSKQESFKNMSSILKRPSSETFTDLQRDFTSRRRGLTADIAVATSAHKAIKRLLLFSGVIPPKDWIKGWRISWVMTRLGVVFTIFYTPFYVVSFGLYSSLGSYWIPSYLSTLVASSAYFWLPDILSRMAADGASSLTPEEAHSVVRVARTFCVFWLFLDLVNFVAMVMTTGYILLPLAKFVSSCATIPILGAFLLALSLETFLAQNAVAGLFTLARTRKITRADYRSVRRHVADRSHRFQRPLAFLAVIALYNTLALVVNILSLDTLQLDADSGSERATSDFLNGITAFVVLGKEAFLLFMFMFLAMNVNDEADALITELSLMPWGDPGSAEEGTRIDVLLLATTYSTRREALHKGMLVRLTTPWNRPISFDMCFLRITTRIFLVAAASFIASIFSRISYEFF